MRAMGRAALVAGAYMAFAGAWIVWSDDAVARVADSVAEFEQLEHQKGLFFVLSTGVGLFFGTYFAIRRLVLETEKAAEARESLLKLERQALAGLFVSSIAHDANNVSVVVSSALSELRQVPGLEVDAREAVEDAQQAMAKLHQLFKDLQGMGRSRASATRAECDLRELVEKTVTLLRGHTAMKHCKVRIVAPDPVRLGVFPGLIDQMLINLLINAADATERRGQLEVRLHVEGENVQLEVHDDGPGVAAEQEALLFKAFNTTKPHGTGLGLLSVKECAGAHGGRVSYARSPLGGACFKVTLPLKAQVVS